MTAPEHDPELVHKLAAMTEDEFHAVVRKARGGATKEQAAEALARYARRNTITAKGHTL